MGLCRGFLRSPPWICLLLLAARPASAGMQEILDAAKDRDFQTTESLSSWNCTAGAGYRFHEELWLFAGAGVAGFGGMTIVQFRP